MKRIHLGWKGHHPNVATFVALNNEGQGKVYQLMTLRLAATALMFLFAVGVTSAQVNYDEATDGDLGDPATPTALGVLGLGSNSVTGTLDNPNGMDPDAFSFSVMAGQQLTGLYFSSMTGINRFFAFSDGPVSTTDPEENLVSTLISSTDVMTNILDGTLNNRFGSGVSGPLDAGSYHVWFQETDGTSVDYSITLQTAAVPEPGTLALLMLAGVSVALLRRK